MRFIFWVNKEQENPMSDFEFDIGDTATSFNQDLNFGLDETTAAVESGITADNAYDFAQGPDGNLGSAIPGAGGDLNNNGWYTVDYNQPAVGVDTQPPLADNAGSIDVNADGSELAALRNDQIAALSPAASDSIGFQGQTDEFGGISNVAPSVVSDKFLNDLAVSQNTLTNILPASLTTTVNDLTASLKSAFASITNRVSPTGTAPVPLSTVTDSQGLPIATGTSGVFVNAPAVSAAVDETAAETARLARGNQSVFADAAAAVDGNTDPTASGIRPQDVGPSNVAPQTVTADENQTAAEAARLTALNNSAPRVSTPSPLDQYLADLAKAKTLFAAQGIPLPSVFTANPVTQSLANNASVNLLPTAFSPTAVGSNTASASIIDAAFNTAANANIAGLSPDQVQSLASTAAAAEAYTLKLAAQAQQVREAQSKEVNNGDWRLRLSLAPGADYLYNATPSGILAPLKNTSGVIFPYTPRISTSYNANYTPTDLTHSNYKNYFYQNSNVGEITIEAKFTAQDTNEAQYLLAVIHFFRSITRMFYGQDAQRGAPPPLVFLTGYGEYQFNQHPCVVTNFTYNMPDNVDYIRARSININGANLLSRRTRQSVPTDPISGAIQRIANLFSSQGISPGAIINRPAPPTLGQNNPTYVPTSVDLTIRLLPMQSRSQVSQQFSLKGFANGDLIRGGFW